ncbi:MAG: RNase adapter RapZ [Deltaproteobacteria bacterium]|nr:RNase adapter RapZ [Deltaproteobacteria bacterium]
MKEIRLVVLSGPSGAGKSTAVRVMEDLGFFCVDNLPVILLPKFLELVAQSSEITKVATVVDVREREFLREFPSIFRAVKEAGHKGELIYLEASDDSLIRRFSETRRRHPLSSAESPIEGIRAERELLKEIKAHADKVVDTSLFTVKELKEHIADWFSSPAARGKMFINLVSFGYRYGIPPDANIVMDVRFLPNPYFVDELKSLDGTHPSVKDFVLLRTETTNFIERFGILLNYLVPLYWKEGKSYLTIAVGCTGGRHRSVVIVDKLCGAIISEYGVPRKRHRDIDKG